MTGSVGAAQSPPDTQKKSDRILTPTNTPRLARSHPKRTELDRNGPKRTEMDQIGRVKASFSAYVLVKKLLKNWGKSALFGQKKNTTNFGLPFCFVPFPFFFCLKMAKMCCFCLVASSLWIGNGPNTVSESAVSNTELSEFFCPHRVRWRELSEFLSAYYLCAKANSPSFSPNSPSLPQNSVSTPSRNSTQKNSIPPVS